MVLQKHKQEQRITSEAKLRTIIPAYPKILDKRILPELDKHCLELIAFSKLIVSAYSDSTIPMGLLSSKDVVIVDSKTISLPLNCCDISPREGTYASLYFLVPGVGHGLRVNGEFQLHEGCLALKIKSTYLHCARAAARSDLWNNSERLSSAVDNQLMSPKQFISASPFLLMKTMNEECETELSPRGDSSGFVQVIDQQQLFIPERPGNKVAVSARNILKNEAVELLMLVPGSDIVMNVHGNATLTDNAQLLDFAIVNNKRPKLGILIEQCRFSLAHCSAIEQTQFWLSETHVNPDRLTRFSKALSAHMNGEGILGKAATPFIGAIVKNDMKNLY